MLRPLGQARICLGPLLLAGSPALSPETYRPGEPARCGRDGVGRIDFFRGWPWPWPGGRGRGRVVGWPGGRGDGEVVVAVAVVGGMAEVVVAVAVVAVAVAGVMAEVVVAVAVAVAGGWVKWSWPWLWPWPGPWPGGWGMGEMVVAAALAAWPHGRGRLACAGCVARWPGGGGSKWRIPGREE